MSLLPVSAIPSADVAYNINNSLRFRSSASANLNRTFSSSPTVRTRQTFSLWIKRGLLSSQQRLIDCYDGSSTFSTVLYFLANDTLQFDFGGSAQNALNTTQVFRDPSAWYHVVLEIDTTQATASNRVKIYVNGLQVTSFVTANYPAQNSLSQLTFGNANNRIAANFNGASDRFDGYMAEVNFIDGQALTPTSFGEINATTGVWQPKAYTGTYGTNGFYQKYSNAGSSAVLVNTTSAVQDTAATTITVNVPSNTANGNLMILLVCSGSGANTWTTPAGWTRWDSGGNGRAIFYRTASSEPASYTITQSGSSTSNAYILTYNNAVIDVMGSYGSAANPSVAPSITTTANNATVFYYVANPGQATNTYSTPTNFTPLVSDLSPTAPTSAVFSRVQATAGATGTASSTIGTGLPFSVQFAIKPISNTNLGLDFSGNGNNWTTTNISVTAGATYDAMIDSPTLTSTTVANYCTANPLDASPSGTSVISNANLTVNVSGSSAGGGFGGQARCNTINFTNVSGKWYWEAFIDNAGTGTATLRLTFFMAAEPINISGQGGPYTWFWRADGVTDLTSPGTFATNDVVMFAYDSDSGKLWVGKNGTWSNSGVPSAGTGQVRTITALAAYALGLNYGTSGGGTGTASFNFGQRPFSYTPPTGFNRINTFNLPTSTIVKGNNFMDATLYTGNGTTQTITNASGLRPDLVWFKERSSNSSNWLFDTIRGALNRISSNETTAAANQAGTLTSFNSNGFSVGSDVASNESGQTYVAWQWQAGSSTVTNTSGTISAQVRANTTTGFSVVTYTGNGTAGATVGHGLGVAPKMIIIKGRGNVDNWGVYHASAAASPATGFLYLNGTQAFTVTSTQWNNTAPTSTVFTVGTDARVNQSTIGFVAYCWAEIAGFSAFGSYTGNNSSNGPFVYLGFRPKFIMFKRTDAAQNWFIFDSSRNLFNTCENQLSPNLSSAESTGSTNVDYLSNGFKIYFSGSAGINQSGTYIYAAFAENPFKNALAR